MEIPDMFPVRELLPYAFGSFVSFVVMFIVLSLLEPKKRK